MIPAFPFNLHVQATTKGNFPNRAIDLKAIMNTIKLVEKTTYDYFGKTLGWLRV